MHRGSFRLSSLARWEVEQQVWTPTADVLMYYKQHLREVAPPEWFLSTTSSSGECEVGLRLLCGADLLESFAVPGLWASEHLEQIARYIGVVCIARHSYDPVRFVYEHDILNRYEFNIHIVRDFVVNEISATKIRRSIRRGESVKYLLPDAVIDYIFEHRLYAQPEYGLEPPERPLAEL